MERLPGLGCQAEGQRGEVGLIGRRAVKARMWASAIVEIQIAADRQLIADATYDPDQLKAIRKAFDDAWAQIEPQVSKRAEAIEAARLKLATIVLSVAKRGTQTPKALTDEALKLMFADPTDLRSP